MGKKPDKLMSVERLAVSSLTPYANNARTHSGEQVEQIARSIQEFGFTNPVLIDNDGGIIAGHGRIMAAERLGLKEVPCIRLTHLTETQKRAYIIADNKLALNAGWDEAALAEEIKAIGEMNFDLSLVGFDPAELEAMLNIGEMGKGESDAEPQIDKAEELNKLWQVKPGDIWLIGDHRLGCGDSTKAEDVGRLLGGRKPLLMVTDPPYGVEYDPAWRAEAGVNKNKGKMGKVANDDIADWSPAWALFPGDVAYVWHAPGPLQAVVLASLECSCFKARSHIIWAKDRLVLSRGDYHWQHEPCWYAVREGKPGHRTDDRKQTTLWEIPARDDSGHGHGTQKPLECMARPMRNHDAPEVFDPFLGSGTTMVAAQNLGRKCYGMELTPNYCAVILQRMKDAFPALEIKRSE